MKSMNDENIVFNCIANIEGEIKWLKEMDNQFATMSAGQIEAMLKRWKDGDEHG